MILFFCCKDDNYFFKVKKWLKYYGCDFEEVDLKEISYCNFSIQFKDGSKKVSFKTSNNKVIDFDSVSLFFYRSSWPIIKDIAEVDFDATIANDYFYLEQETLLSSVFSSIQNKTIGWLSNVPLNKLTQMDTATEVGLKVPDYLLTTSSDSVQAYFNSKPIVVKAIQENIYEASSSEFLYQRVTKIQVKDLPSIFQLSFFQEYIEKEIEIRCFYLDGFCYSIGSVCDKKLIDHRDSYNEEHHFRIELPSDINSKIQKFMNRMGLIAGSIDLVVAESGEIYFLEVNTQGQYDALSYFGSYILEKKIAEFCLEKEQL